MAIDHPLGGRIGRFAVTHGGSRGARRRRCAWFKASDGIRLGWRAMPKK